MIRNFKWSYKKLLSLFIPLFCLNVSHLNAQSHPNVLVIMLDDSRYDPYRLDGGPPVFKTPAIDSLGDEGVRFNQTFADYSLCSPSRSSIYTGLYPNKTGVEEEGDSMNGALENKTLAYILQKQGGYYTGLVGKYGIIRHKGSLSSKIPFGYNYWFQCDLPAYFNMTYNDNGHDTIFPQHKTDVFTAHAIHFLQSVPLHQPFLLFLNHGAPHLPYEPRWLDSGFFKGAALPFPVNYEEYTNNYPDNLYPQHIEPYDSNYLHNARDTMLRDSLTEAYYEMLIGLESSISSVIRELKNEGKYDSTVIIFTSDNGFLMGEHYLTEKWLAYEPSIKLPMYIRYPAWFQPGMVVDSEIAMNLDLFPTILMAAGITDTFHDDGLSLRDLATGQAHRKQFLYTAEFSDGIPGIRAVRGLRYKLIETMCADTTEEFFDLYNDPNENVNLIFDPAYKALIMQSRFEIDSLRNSIDDIDYNPVRTCSLQNLKQWDAINNILDDPPSTKLDIFRFFPNPVADQLAVEIYNPLFANLVFKIYDVKGDEKSRGLISDRKQVEFSTIPFDNLPAGIYCVQVNDGWNTSTIKVIKQ